MWRCLAWAALLLSCAASAQSQTWPAFSLSRFSLNDGGAGALTLATGDTLPRQRFRATLGFHYENNPLVSYRAQERTGAVVGHRGQVQVGLGYGVTSWLQVTAGASMVVLQQGDVVQGSYGTPDSWGVGSPHIAFRAALLSQGKGGLVSDAIVDVAAQLGAGIPIGFQNALNVEAAWTWMPQLSFGHTFATVRWGGEISAIVRPQVRLTANSAVGHQVAMRLGVSTLGDGARFELSAQGTLGVVNNAGAGLELLTGARIPLGPLELLAVAGPGFGDLPGTPSFRVWLGLGVHTEPHVDVCRTGQTHTLAQCPDNDDDGDGVSNAVDQCPKVKEDLDGFLDEDGCLDSDDDGDQLVDALDECPDEPGLPSHHGCPASEVTVTPHAEQQWVVSARVVPVQVQRRIGRQVELSPPLAFVPGKAVLEETSKRVLGALAEWLRKHPEVTALSIEGYVANQGSVALNQKLSVNRARAVRGYLVHHGIDEERLTVMGKGVGAERIELVIEPRP